MILTLWRHGQAADSDIDRLRELTPSGADDVVFGRERFEVVCGNRNIMPPDYILSSPLVRTTQTAQILAAAFSQASLMSEKALQPEGDVDAVDSVVHGLYAATAGNSHVVMVSHQPLLSRLVGQFLGAGNRVPFLSPGSWVTLSIATHPRPSAGLLFWALPPEYEVQE